MGQQAYCLKCRAFKEVTNSKTSTSKNGRKVMKGFCAVCHTKMSKFLPN